LQIVFQTMGLFSNCLCYLPISWWANRWSPSATMSLSADSSQQIYFARHYWLPIGVSATVFLILTTYLGWQYQHRLRRKFTKLAEHLDKGTGETTASPSMTHVAAPEIMEEQNLKGLTHQIFVEDTFSGQPSTDGK